MVLLAFFRHTLSAPPPAGYVRPPSFVGPARDGTRAGGGEGQGEVGVGKAALPHLIRRAMRAIFSAPPAEKV